MSNSLLLISFNSNVENPGVSAIYVFSSNSYNFTNVVVFLPLLLLWLICPSSVMFLSNKLFIIAR